MSTPQPANAAPQIATSPPPDRSASPLPPIMNSPPSARSTLPRPMSHASKNRLSQYSQTSMLSRSRPVSHVFPVFTSSLPYALVRDFAYPAMHPMHYGPPPESSRPPSGMTTPASEQRRLSDSQAIPWDQKMPWDSWTSDGFNRGHDVPPIHFGDGPPYSEDEDLQSPVVATRHKKQKSASAMAQARAQYTAQELLHPTNYEGDRGYYDGSGGNANPQYYGARSAEGDAPGAYAAYTQPSHDLAHQYGQPPHGSHDGDEGSDESGSPLSAGFQDDQSRYSRDYHFTITSPDEEFHGKAVALFDFERENENELPLAEGQIIWVSYRHGQGWLVAEDPKTRESGLVPEEYVRLLRDIRGGELSLTGHAGEGNGSPNDVGTPVQAEHGPPEGTTTTAGNPTNGYNQPVVSIFSTSSKDLNPYPTDQLGLHAGQAPPQVVHYHGQRGGSQAATPTIASHQEFLLGRRESKDAGADNTAQEVSLPVGNMESD